MNKGKREEDTLLMRLVAWETLGEPQLEQVQGWRGVGQGGMV